jgi:hypothetical protein
MRICQGVLRKTISHHPTPDSKGETRAEDGKSTLDRTLPWNTRQDKLHSHDPLTNVAPCMWVNINTSKNGGETVGKLKEGKICFMNLIDGTRFCCNLPVLNEKFFDNVITRATIVLVSK